MVSKRNECTSFREHCCSLTHSIPTLPSLCTSEITQHWRSLQGAGLGRGMLICSGFFQDCHPECCLVWFHIPSPTPSAVQHRSPPSPGQVSQGWVDTGNEEVFPLSFSLLSHAMECVCTPLLPTLPPSLPKAPVKSIYPWGMTPKAFPAVYRETVNPGCWMRFGYRECSTLT